MLLVTLRRGSPRSRSKMKEITALAEELETQLVLQHGPMLTGATLTTALGYRSQDAFRQACVRGTVPVVVFAIEHRRGRYALSRDVARWIAEQRLQPKAGNNLK